MAAYPEAMEYWKVAEDLYVRTDRRADFAECFISDLGWVENVHWIDEIFYNGGGEPVREPDALAAIASLVAA